MPKSYVRKKDRSLTNSQAKDGFARPKNYRAPSNKTLDGYSTGYHESAVTTDTYYYLKEAKLKGKFHELTSPMKNGKINKSSFFYKERYPGQKVYSSTLQKVLKAADGFRTDTAQTALSAPFGKVAGHSGSNLSTVGQDAAHNLLRKTVMDVLQEDPSQGIGEGITEESIYVLFGAITTTSVAPGEMVRAMEGGSKSLKAKPAKANWEQNRNEAKNRLLEEYNDLETPTEKNFVSEYTQRFLDSTQEDVPSHALRTLAPNAPSSPIRDTLAPQPDEVSGGGYSSTATFSEPSIGMPASFNQSGTHLTSPYRAARREIESDADELIELLAG